jgi:hypothetical protein
LTFFVLLRGLNFSVLVIRLQGHTSRRPLTHPYAFTALIAATNSPGQRVQEFFHPIVRFGNFLCLVAMKNLLLPHSQSHSHIEHLALCPLR